MEVILLEKVDNLGVLGDAVKVKPGYARNYLLPKAKAVAATKENIALFEAKRADLEQQQARILADAKARAEKLDGLVLTVPARAGDGGKLFGSISARDIATTARESDIEIPREAIRMPLGPLREVGPHTLTLHLHPDVETTITVDVAPET